jgi:hypothetical protein
MHVAPKLAVMAFIGAQGARTRFYMPVLQGVFMKEPGTAPAAKAEIGKLAGTHAARLGPTPVSG